MDKLKTFNTFMNDIWQFYKQHYPPRRDDEYWAKVVADAEVLEQRYGSKDKTMHSILLDVIEGLEREELNEQRLQNPRHHQKAG